jgi:hypothetical protein
MSDVDKGAGTMFAPVFTGGENLNRVIAAALATLLSFGVFASEPVVDETLVAAEAVALSTDSEVVVTPIPMPASVIELATTGKPVVKLRSARRSKLAQNRPLPKMMLSRVERHQMALLAPKPKNGEQAVSKQLHDQNGDAGYDELVIHRSFNRPKLVSEIEDDEDASDTAELSETIKLRLFIARMRAVEAHALAQVGDTDDDLSDTVKLRLANARMNAVQAHRNKFS